jgi:ribonuclease HII
MKYFKNMSEFVMGVDEAGRGPVIGPLVVASVILSKTSIKTLTSLGLKDSKLLSKKKRNLIFTSVLDEALFFSVCVAWPSVIDSYVLENSLNKLECEMMASVINAYKKDFIDVYVDSPEKPLIFKEKLKNLNVSYNLNCSFKADLRYPVVSAASILAKFYRDSIIDSLKKEFGDFGSGYPSDKKTKNFVKQHFLNPPNIIRKQWKTYKDLNGLFR